MPKIDVRHEALALPFKTGYNVISFVFLDIDIFEVPLSLETLNLSKIPFIPSLFSLYSCECYARRGYRQAVRHGRDGVRQRRVRHDQRPHRQLHVERQSHPDRLLRGEPSPG